MRRVGARGWRSRRRSAAGQTRPFRSADQLRLVLNLGPLARALRILFTSVDHALIPAPLRTQDSLARRPFRDSIVLDFGRSRRRQPQRVRLDVAGQLRTRRLACEGTLGVNRLCEIVFERVCTSGGCGSAAGVAALTVSLATYQ